MFYWFSTTPADKEHKPGKRPQEKTPSRTRTMVTWGLFAVWILLFSFGGISIVNPKWLQELSRPGRDSESQNYKDYADNFLRQNNYRMAITQYQRAMEIKPNFVGASVNLAITYGRMGDYARAENILKDALQTNTAQKGVIYYNLGELCEKQKRTEQAIQYYQQALSFEFQQDLIYRKLGALYLAAERYDEARAAFEMMLAIQLNPSSSYRNMLLGCMDMFEEDTTNLQIIKEQLAQNIRVEDFAGYDLTIIRSMQQRDPEVAKTHNFLGFIYARLGDNAGAIEHFEESLKIWPGNTDAKKNLQVLHQLQEKQQVSVPSE